MDVKTKDILDTYCVKYNGGDFRNYLKLEYYNEEISNSLRIFKLIKLRKNILKDGYISIQASRAHYCYPQRTVEDLKEYKSMEIAFKKNDELLPYREAYALILQNLPKDLVDRITLCNYGTVYSNIAIEDIQKLIELIC